MAKKQKNKPSAPKNANGNNGIKPGNANCNNGIRLGIAEIGAMISLSILIWVYSPQIASFFGQWSYFGIFTISLIASASVFFPTAPLQVAIISMGRMLDPLLVGIAAGIGSGIGELSGFFIGTGSAHLLKSKDKTARWIMKLQKDILKKYAGAGVFVLALVPNPLFDMAGIFAGIIGMKWWEFVIWCIAGRVLRYIVLAYLGAAVGWI